MSAISPYYVSPDGAVTVFHADWRKVVAAGLVPIDDVALIHGDPPYGIGYTAERKRGRPSTTKSSGGTYGKPWKVIEGDKKPFDPRPIVALRRPTVLWGANNYATKLPDSGGWIVWDKKRGGTASQAHKASDAELAWTTIGRMVDLFSYFWDGFRREGEVGSHLYPMQKPVALCAFVFRFAGLKPGDIVFVPWMGSGPDLAAAHAMGLRVIACDVDQGACDIALAARLHVVAATAASSHAGPLFAGGHR